MSAGDEPGLGLFDEMASAAGNFPTALRGYDRTAVDDYVRTLEASVVESRRQVTSLQAQVGSLAEQLEATRRADADDVDYSDLGGRATDILRLAEEQAREVLDHANIDAEKMREEARRESDQLRLSANREGGELKSTGLAELDRLRRQLETDAANEIARARAESEALVAAARRQADSLRAEAEHHAQTVRQTAYLDTEDLRRAVDSEVAGLRQQVAHEREQALHQLRAVHEDAVQRTAALLAEATAHNQASAERLEADIAEASRIRTEALAEAERVKLAAAQEAEGRLQAAREMAASISDRTQQEFSWRKQQLKRETDLLTQRKQAVLNQLASLSALAQQTASSFPDLEDLDEFDAEAGDQTVLRRPDAPPALPDRGAEQGTPEDPADRVPDEPAEASEEPARINGADGSDRSAGADEAEIETRQITLAPAGEESSDSAQQVQPDPVDDDATVVVSAGGPPAGTARLQAHQAPDASGADQSEPGGPQPGTPQPSTPQH